MRIRLLESLLVGGEVKKTGDVVDVTDQEAKILVMIGRAAVAEEPDSGKAKPARGRYKRRDMRAERRQYETK